MEKCSFVLTCVMIFEKQATPEVQATKEKHLVESISQ
jgi:hypothetical protein